MAKKAPQFRVQMRIVDEFSTLELIWYPPKKQKNLDPNNDEKIIWNEPDRPELDPEVLNNPKIVRIKTTVVLAFFGLLITAAGLMVKL